MTRDEFWLLVEKVHTECKGDFDDKLELLETELGCLPLDEVLSFADHYDACRIQAYTFSLWGAAFVVNGGCSDDGFIDFRSELVSLGREHFERILANPEVLVEYPWFKGFEGYQYVAPQVWEGRSGKDLPPSKLAFPKEPSGTPWEESDLPTLFPKLAKHYKFEA